MSILLAIPTVLSLLVLGAHWLRSGNPILTIVTLALIGLLGVRRAWGTRVLQLVLILATVEWICTSIAIAQERMVDEQPWARSAVILGAVALFTLLSAWLLQVRLKRRPLSAAPAA
jgi:hypothetical protein